MFRALFTKMVPALVGRSRLCSRVNRGVPTISSTARRWRERADCAKKCRSAARERLCSSTMEIKYSITRLSRFTSCMVCRAVPTASRGRLPVSAS